MTEDLVLTIGADAIKVTLMLAGPLLFAAMFIGIIVSVFQAITQINEATLTFIPKIVAIVLVMVILAPWMLKTAQEYAAGIYGNLMDWMQ